MPVITPSYRKKPFYLFNGHMETVIPSIFWKIDGVEYARERLELDDGDFLDLDWIKGKYHRLMIIGHGLEGNSERYYVKRMAKYFAERGWDILAWNCRSCSGEMNRLPRFYHHGETGDLRTVVNHALKGGYKTIALTGSSMGGSMILKYLGEQTVPKEVKLASTFSVPCDLAESAIRLEEPQNRIYNKKFLRKLNTKLKIKAERFPEIFQEEQIDELKSLGEFTEKFTAPLHGFKDATDFYKQASCDQYLQGIKIPVFIGNARNDPMLGEKCHPVELARTRGNIFLESPRHGGHVGFILNGFEHSWMELRTEEFLKEKL